MRVLLVHVHISLSPASLRSRFLAATVSVSFFRTDVYKLLQVLWVVTMSTLLPYKPLQPLHLLSNMEARIGNAADAELLCLVTGGNVPRTCASIQGNSRVEGGFLGAPFADARFSSRTALSGP